MLTELTNSVIRERRIPDDWLRSMIVQCWKGKGNNSWMGKLLKADVVRSCSEGDGVKIWYGKK